MVDLMQEMTVKEVAKFLKQSRSWVYGQIKTGTIPCYKQDGKSYRFNPLKIQAWRRANESAQNKDKVEKPVDQDPDKPINWPEA